MAQWRLRRPGSFPYTFHDALPGLGVKVAARGDHKWEIERLAVQWNLFMFSLRNHPLHPLHGPATALKHRCKVKFNPELQQWELLLTTTSPISAEIQNIDQILGETR